MIYTNFTRPDGARRNLLTYSEQFDNAYWGKTACSAVSNSITSPSGSLTADSIIENTANTFHVVIPSTTATVVTGQTITISIFAKALAGDRFLQITAGSATFTVNAFANFDLLAGTPSSVGSAASAAMSPHGSGWFRCSITISAVAGGNIAPFFLLQASGIASRYQAYTGDGSSGIYLWGAQLDAGGLTEYQPVVSGLEFSVEPLNHARIGWQNLAFGITPTSSTAAAGFPAIAATYPTTFEFWKPTALPATWTVDMGSAKTVDYFGLVGDMNGATVALQSSTDNSTWTTQQTQSGLTDRINMFLFLPVSARYWRLLITVAIPSIAVVYIGQALDMQRMIYQGHTPLTLSRTTELSNNISEGGQYLGRSIIRKGAKTGFGWQHLKADWYRANFDPFVKAARTAPFFIAWRPSQYPSEMGFVWVDGDIAPSNSGPRDFMAVDMNVMGLINE